MGISIHNLNGNNNTVSSLLSSLPSAGSSGAMENLTNSVLGTSTSSGVNLTDYAAIKNGSYYKLLKAYYAKDTTTDKTEDNSSSNSDSNSENSALRTSSTSLKASADALLTTGNNLLFQSRSGNDLSTNSKDYDMSSIAEAVTDFASDYNNLLTSAKDSDNTKVQKTISTLKNTADVYSKVLSSVGITVGDDGSLSVDQKKLKTANVGTLKTLFNNSVSFASQIESAASSINAYVKSDVTKKNSGLYNSSGNYQSAADIASSLNSYT
ncbi:MAG: hypothetical protein PHP50_10940 [Lachnospiraceae bacterium]|nr:hypothetical protein [Lachnospiraceae bacterium]